MAFRASPERDDDLAHGGSAPSPLSRAADALARAILDPTFLRFAVVGLTGYTVDALVLHAMMDGFGLNHFTGRLVSFCVAVAVTWNLNRLWTFRAAGQGDRVRQAAIYLGVQCCGGLANLAAYNAAIFAVPALKHWPAILIALAAGSGAGMVLNFAGAKHLAFRPRIAV